MDGDGVRQEQGHRGGSKGDGASRREVVNLILGLGAGGVAAAVFYPIVNYIVPPQEAQSAANSVALSVKPEEVKPNSGQIFKFGNKPAILIRTPSGDLRAFTAVCTHLGCIVEYRPDLSQIWCACHNGVYDLNGRNVSGPPPKPLTPFDVRVRGTQIVVSRKA